MSIILDSGFLYALVDLDDSRSNRAFELLKHIQEQNFSQILTVSPVIHEVHTLLIYRTNGNLHLLSVLHDLFWGKMKFFQILEIYEKEWQEIALLLQKYVTPKKLLSFIDAALIYTAVRLKISRIVSFDSHFDGILDRLH